MMPYSRGIILDSSGNYGIVKTETVFGFRPTAEERYDGGRFNSTEPLEWIITRGNFAPRSLQVSDRKSSKEQKLTLSKSTKESSKKTKKRHIQDGNRKGKGKKCVFKVVKKADKKNRGNKVSKMRKKYMMPLLLGLLAAKSLLIPIALKALAFISAKGLMMGFFSTVMASVLSLKGMFDHQHSYQNRKDDTKTQVEIIQVPSKSEDHIYYDEHYKRGDYVPALMNR